MNYWIAAPLFGVIGAVAMIVFLYSLHALRITNGDMLRALGSAITKREEGSFKVGLLLHLFLGAIFGFLYLGLWGLMGASTNLSEMLLLGMMVGFGHGVAFSFAMVILVAEHHPLARFRKVGFSVALAHLLAHIVYGVILGFLVSKTQVDLSSLRQAGRNAGILTDTMPSPAPMPNDMPEDGNSAPAGTDATMPEGQDAPSDSGAGGTTPEGEANPSREPGSEDGD